MGQMGPIPACHALGTRLPLSAPTLRHNPHLRPSMSPARTLIHVVCCTLRQVMFRSEDRERLSPTSAFIHSRQQTGFVLLLVPPPFLASPSVHALALPATPVCLVNKHREQKQQPPPPHHFGQMHTFFNCPLFFQINCTILLNVQFFYGSWSGAVVHGVTHF